MAKKRTPNRGRKKASRGLVPPDETIKWDIFVKPLNDARKKGVENHHQAMHPDTQREVLLEQIRYQREFLRRKYRTSLFAFARNVLGYDKMEEGSVAFETYVPPKKIDKDNPPTPMDTIRFRGLVDGKSSRKGFVFVLELKLAPGLIDETWRK